MTGPDTAPAWFAPPGPFSYAEVDDTAAAVAWDAAGIIRGIHRQAIQEIGRSLLRAKEALPHGAFTRWLRDVVGIEPTTAGNYMRTARLLDGKPATVADLSPTVLYALASPSAPAEVVQAVVDVAAAGGVLDPGGIEAQLQAAKRADAELKAAQRRNPGLTHADLNAKKAKADRRWKAQAVRDAAEQAQKEQAIQNRLRPLADASLDCPGNVASHLVAMLNIWTECRALRTLLDAGLREAGQ